jgi:predicted choloylglycine hydrolase
VIAKAQRPWGGCLDGMNDDGLVASLTFGGSVRNGVTGASEAPGIKLDGRPA